MEKALNTLEFENLCEAILTLENKEEAKCFFRDLCTISELKAMSERFEVVQQLNKGVSYRIINQNTGVSTATITRVSHWLHHGMGGYRLILKKLKS